jgi:tetratricopeptide (TPR) repeat protein
LKSSISPSIPFFLLITILFAGGCSSKKDTVVSVGMQNLTARYNILYNAKELINESEKNIETAHIDDYEQLLSVYKEPTTVSSQAEIKNLDSVIRKMNFLVDEKVKSNYVDDAYFLKGKANYLKSSYFNASEFFNYVYNTYKKDKELKQASLAWKARTLLQLNNLPEAGIVLDSALKNISTEKKSVADIYATSAQWYIKSGKIPDAVQTLEKAIRFEKAKSNRIRWTYLLAQLQELNNQNAEAYTNYTKIIKSTAPFEMAFNANLNRINIEETQNAGNSNQLGRLNALLKDNKSKEFIDQIHYRIAGLYQKNGQEEEAIKSLNTSIRNSVKNQNQKGLSYLQIAEIYFKNGDYEHAKIYYDSTLTALAPAYPNYEQIRLKSSNLDLLAKNFLTISSEKTFQALASLSAAQRDHFIDSLFQKQAQLAAGNSAASNPIFTASAAGGKFYFNNPTALSLGLEDFRKRWGNRKLEDNWRRINKSSAELTSVPIDANGGSGNFLVNTTSTIDSMAFRKSYIDNLPLTSAQLDLSNQKIANSYYEIANFYKDVLKDDQGAIKTYLQILNSYPDNSIKAAIYYNLYRLYSTIDPAKSAQYRDMLVKQFPETAFARIIVDPDYSRKADEKSVALNKAYDEIYNLYLDKKYTDVIVKIAESEQRFGKTSFSSQLAYLNSLAVGHTQKLDVLETSLQQIVQAYPDDKLITPLVQQNLEYIKANHDNIAKREVALIDFDPNEPRFVVEPKQEAIIQNPTPRSTPAPSAPANIPAPVTSQSVTAPPPVAQPNRPAANTPATAPNTAAPVAEKPPIPYSAIFSLPDTAEYYYVININAYGVNLSSSRFGVGQFNRSNYSGIKISHQAQNVNRENQLIFVGPFNNRSEVERYQSSITPLLTDIMKIPARAYNSFIITKNGLDKLNSRNLINNYLDFYTSSTK